MDKKYIEEISNWIASEMDFRAGLELYIKYGRSANQKRIITKKGKTIKTEATLLYELKRLIKFGIPKPPKKRKKAKKRLKAQQSTTEFYPNTRLPTLAESVPRFDTSKINKKWKLLYKEAVVLHNTLEFVEEEERKRNAFRILDNFDKIHPLWEEKEYIEKFGTSKPPNLAPDSGFNIDQYDISQLLTRQKELKSKIKATQYNHDRATLEETKSKHRTNLERYHKELEVIDKKLRR